MTDFVMSDDDLALMFPEKTRIAPKAVHAPEPSKLMTADEIVAEEQRRADAHHHASTTFGRAATVPQASGTPPRMTPATTGQGVVFADQVPAAAPTSASDSAVLTTLQEIRDELRAIAAMLAVGVNKLPARK